MDQARARALLGVAPSADPVAVARAFRRGAATTHPDRGGDPARFQLLVDARDTLAGPAPAPTGRRPPVVIVRPPSVGRRILLGLFEALDLARAPAARRRRSPERGRPATASRRVT